jgi:hypothetical protein
MAVMGFRRIFCGCFCSCLVIVPAGPALRAQVQAPPSTSSSSAKPIKKSASAAKLPLDAGSVSAGAYRNPAFGFVCKIPAGWVLRTEEMNAPGDDAENAAEGKLVAPDAKASRVFLAAFSRPPAAHGEDVNASILIAAESAASYPGLKDAAQYFGPLTEVATAQGFEIDEDPYEFVAQAKTLVRGDFEKDVGTRVMRQSTLVMLARGYAVSFTFIGGTDDEVEELVEGLSFTLGAKSAK